MEKHTYTAEEVKKIEDQLMEKEIKNGSNKEMQLSLCLRYGVPQSKINCILRHIEKLSDTQTVDICTCILMDMDLQTIEQMCRNPKELETYKRNCLEANYAPKRQEIYQEVFQEFHIRWQTEFDQLRGQTDMLSRFFVFLQVQIEKKDEEIKELSKYRESRMETLIGKQPDRKIENVPYGKREKEEKVRKEKPQKTAPKGKQLEGETLAEKAKGFLFKEQDPETFLIRLFAKLEEGQMEAVLDGYEKGLSIGEIKKYAKKEYSAKKMQEIKKLLLRKHV
ncbi:MAG: hypothetical protein E7B11_27890 [Clostridiales bacterium]|nr:hypothetical protein [Clostridiales bacterium]MDU3244370.1 hypothetical protein [Clostridiales bacterium]